MSTNPPDTAPDRLTPVTEAARQLGGSPALYVALIEGGLVEGQLIDGVWHVDTGVVGAALAVRETRPTSHVDAGINMVDAR